MSSSTGSQPIEGPFLSIKLFEGRNLEAADLDGKSDPYVIFSFGGKKIKSKIIKKNLNPGMFTIFQFN